MKRYDDTGVRIREDDAVELRIYCCPTCWRLWAITTAVNTDDVAKQERFIQTKIIGTTHFKWRRKSWMMCWGVPKVVDHPAAVAACHLGGTEAVEAMCPPAQAP